MPAHLTLSFTLSVLLIQGRFVPLTPTWPTGVLKTAVTPLSQRGMCPSYPVGEDRRPWYFRPHWEPSKHGMQCDYLLFQIERNYFPERGKVWILRIEQEKQQPNAFIWEWMSLEPHLLSIVHIGCSGWAEIRFPFSSHSGIITSLCVTFGKKFSMNQTFFLAPIKNTSKKKKSSENRVRSQSWCPSGISLWCAGVLLQWYGSSPPPNCSVCTCCSLTSLAQASSFLLLILNIYNPEIYYWMPPSQRTMQTSQSLREHSSVWFPVFLTLRLDLLPFQRFWD
jgi:hypothetical protein